MRQSIILVFSLFTFLTIVSCQNADVKSRVEVLPPSAFVESYLNEEEALLIDCRTPTEVNRGKIEGAVNIDYNGTDFTSEIEKLDKKQPVYIYCQSGGRSGAAAEKLMMLGFEDIHDMKGGYGAYTRDK